MHLSRLLSFLAAFAMLVAPLGMVCDSAAIAAPPAQQDMAAHAAMATDHCADANAAPHKGSSDAPSPKLHCMMACAALPPAIGAVAAEPMLAAARPDFAFPAFGIGLDPEAETPPPRFS